MKYRPDIDGLRAVAVIAVVVYHAGFVLADTPVLAGGFIGVDVFFVISGYLITSLIGNDLAAGRFSIRNFYERRVRRILPALMFLLIVAVPAAHFVLAPAALQEFSGSVIGALLFYANVFFYLQDSYAAEPSQLKPLLHMWSLAVEEQFYIVFPPLAALLWRTTRRVRGVALGSLLFASLVSAQYMSTRNSDANFFLTPFRAWELLAGSMLALYGDRLRANLPNLGRWLPGLGLLAIIGSFVAFDENTLHPSVVTLLPVLGTVAIVGFPNHRSWTTRWLSWRPLVGIGLISYSLYLWHFVIFAFGRNMAEGEVGFGHQVSWIALSIVMAVISWRFVERPFRVPGYISARRVVLASGALALVLGGVSVAQVRQDVASAYPNIPSDLQPTFATWEDPYSSLGECVDQSDFLDPATWCRLGVASTRADFVLVGDSHAHAQAAVFDAAAHAVGQSGLLVSRSGCPLLLDLEPARGAPSSQNCLDLADRVLEVVTARDIEHVILASRWNYYTCGEPQPDCGFTQNVRLRNRPFSDSRTIREQYLAEALVATVAEYSGTGAKLGLLAEVPHQGDDPRAIFDAAFEAGDLSHLAQASVDRASHIEFTNRARGILAVVAAGIDNVSVLDQTDVLCPGGEWCPVGTPGGSTYSDDNHLSVGAVPILKDWATDVLER